MKKDRRQVDIRPWFHIILIGLAGLISIILLFFRTLNNGTNSLVDYILFFVLAVCILGAVISNIKSATIDLRTGIANDISFTLFSISLFIRKKLSNYDVAFINLKDYKIVNKLAGSDGGDKGLIEYAQTMQKFLIRGEKIARLGGDNFIVLFYKNRLDDFLYFISEINVEFNLDNITHQFKINSRCGLYSLEATDGVGSVFTYSALALNYAKSVGEDIVWYNEKIAEAVYKEKEFSTRFKDAIKNKEFQVYYQPKINLLTNQMTGCEALVRWIKDDIVLLPLEFIPAFENNGTIDELDQYVFEQVCKDISEWNKKGLNCVKVSTNFSKINLRNKDFSQMLLSVIKKYKIDENLLEVELTESSNHEDYEKLIRFLKEMNDNNISNAIDAFGVGYSSLELLKNKNVNVVKLDKQFIDNIQDNNGENDNILLLKNILNLCSELKKEVVCEGVETEAQKEILKKLNFKHIQGFFYDKPLSKEDFEQRLKNSQY